MPAAYVRLSHIYAGISTRRSAFCPSGTQRKPRVGDAEYRQLGVHPTAVERQVGDVEGALVEHQAGREVEVVLAKPVVPSDQPRIRRQDLDLAGQSRGRVLG